MKIIEGGITSAKGFKAGGVTAGIKSDTSLLDMAAISSDVPASIAGTFTKNVLKAAPVIWDKNTI